MMHQKLSLRCFLIVSLITIPLDDSMPLATKIEQNNRSLAKKRILFQMAISQNHYKHSSHDHFA